MARARRRLPHAHASGSDAGPDAGRATGNLAFRVSGIAFYGLSILTPGMRSRACG